MRTFIRTLIWLIRGIKVYALVGKPGTGKSFRARLVAQKYGIELILDDGLLIRDDKILAGKSAKKEKTFLGAVKTSLLDEESHRTEIFKALQRQRFKRILIIGTSDKMVKKIALRLGLPAPTKFIRIEEVASEEEIETAMRSRTVEGKHVIPVPAIEISRNYPSIVYDTIKVFFQKKLLFNNTSQAFEKTVVQPEYGKKGRVYISEAALTQMVLHCAEEFDDSIVVKKVSMKYGMNGYTLGIFIHVPFGVQMSGSMHSFQQYIVENLERFTGIMIDKVDVTIQEVSYEGKT
ncbi:MAG TPA: hypothetical protein PLG43_04090 [Spirochaetia bacterium]|jgi:uncharacterized alkaline shock family protein YloU/adenylate kinase family enzyme|nr:hypothetical protein [Spirochaetia bacterium]